MMVCNRYLRCRCLEYLYYFFGWEMSFITVVNRGHLGGSSGLGPVKATPFVGLPWPWRREVHCEKVSVWLQMLDISRQSKKCHIATSHSIQFFLPWRLHSDIQFNQRTVSFRTGPRDMRTEHKGDVAERS